MYPVRVADCTRDEKAWMPEACGYGRSQREKTLARLANAHPAVAYRRFKIS